MAWLERHWESITPVSALLYPASLLYGAVAAARRAALAPSRLPVPVVVVGNITAGGTGKTPLVLWLAEFLKARGRAPGIVSRGYGGSVSGPAAVAAGDDPRHYGDEPVLIAQRSGCPVWIGADRAAAGRALLSAHSACDVILSDDGMQHYGLARDVEICVVDAARGFGNGWRLPAGPLRERPSRLARVDAVVLNTGTGGTPHPSVGEILPGPARFAMSLAGEAFDNVRYRGEQAGADRFRGKHLHAVAGIGDPQRFFRQLESLGLNFTPHPFPDHHDFTAGDLEYAGAEAVLMTEKDAVKCQRYANERHWALRVDAQVDAALGELVLRKLEVTSREPRTTSHGT